MKVSDQFKLDEHSQEYLKRPLKSVLYFEGIATRAKLPGYDLLLALKLNNENFLMIVDYDCPFEEETTAVLLNHNFKIKSKKRFPMGELIDGSSFKPLTSDTFLISTFGDRKYSVRIKKKRRFFWESLFEISVS